MGEFPKRAGCLCRRLGGPARLGATCLVIMRPRRDNCRCTSGKLAHYQVAPSSHSLPRSRGGRPENASITGPSKRRAGGSVCLHLLCVLALQFLSKTLIILFRVFLIKKESIKLYLEHHELIKIPMYFVSFEL